MRARAPGKIVLTGAYAVLEGAPALVIAVDRHAVADSERPDPAPSPELRAAFGDAPAPSVDTRALFEGAHKLGLGSSAAVVVAALAAATPAEQLQSDEGRRQLFQRARAAHAAAQGGGSGIDIAASTYGGVLEYRLNDPAPRPRVWPAALRLDVFFAGSSAKTSGLLARVSALALRDPSAHAQAMAALCEASVHAARDWDEPPAFLRAAREFGRALATLGALAEAPIVTPAFAELAERAEAEDAVFFGAGAGGGDVAVRLGETAVSAAFVARAEALGLRRLQLAIEPRGASHS